MPASASGPALAVEFKYQETPMMSRERERELVNRFAALKKVNLADGVRKYLGRGAPAAPTRPTVTEKVLRRKRVSRLKAQ
jgi:hypothetical protein